MKQLTLPLVLALLLIGAVSACSPPMKTIGILNGNPAHEVTVETFIAELAEAGWREGDNVTYLYEGGTSDPDERLRFAEALVAAEPDLLVVVPSDAAGVLKGLTTEIPILFLAAPDPVGQGLVESMGSPGGNITGVKVGGFLSKQLEMVGLLFPEASRILIPHDTASAAGQAAFDTASSVAGALGFEVDSVELTNDDQLPDLFSAMETAEVVVLVPGTPITRNAIAIAEVGMELGVPVIGYSDLHSRGALASYGAVREDFARAAIPLALDLLDGVPPSEVAVTTVTFGLRLNTDTAERIGYTFPDLALQQAVEIVP